MHCFRLRIEICFDIAFGVSRLLRLKVVTEDVKLTSALSGDSIGTATYGWSPEFSGILFRDLLDLITVYLLNSSVQSSHQSIGLKIMGLRASRLKGGFSPYLALLLIVCLAASLVSSQESATETNDSNGLIKDLGRRSKIFVDKNDAINEKTNLKSVVLDLDLDAGLGIFDAFFASFSMIIVSEIGDETFIIAALMAMRHPKSIVLSGALSALFVMTSIYHGFLPFLDINFSGHVLYAFFGLRLLYIAWRSDSTKGSQKKEMEEVEEKLEAGQGKSTARRFFSRFCTPIFLESFILTFLAEWGDRSQIATIALATHKNAVGVAVGATLGHTICTSVAVVGGSMLASKISQGCTVKKGFGGGFDSVLVGKMIEILMLWTYLLGIA
ncbi:hypothetical protein LguiB_005137 [Lonicera macranthoides]